MLDRLRAAVTAARESFGPDDGRTLAARRALSRGLQDDDRYEEAHVELVALADDHARIFGPEHPDTLSALLDTAVSSHGLYLKGVDPVGAWMPEAVRLREQVAAARERLYGGAHPDTLDVWERLSFAYTVTQRVAESQALDERIVAGWRQVLADRERDLGPDAPETQTARLRLANKSEPHVAEALRAAAVTSWGRIAAERSATLGPIHPDTIVARERHAEGQSWLGRPGDELRLTQDIVADLLGALGPSDPRTLRAQVQLMIKYINGGEDLDAAIEIGERIIDEVRQVFGAHHPELRRVRSLLVYAYYHRGRIEDADAVIDRYPIPAEDDF